MAEVRLLPTHTNSNGLKELPSSKKKIKRKRTALLSVCSFYQREVKKVKFEV